MSQTVLAYAGLGGGAGAAGAAPPGGGGGGGARSTLALARECVMRAKPEEILDGTATLPEDALLFVVRWLCQLGQGGWAAADHRAARGRLCAGVVHGGRAACDGDLGAVRAVVAPLSRRKTPRAQLTKTLAPTAAHRSPCMPPPTPRGSARGDPDAGSEDGGASPAEGGGGEPGVSILHAVHFD
jgi:hypothetical protein